MIEKITFDYEEYDITAKDYSTQANLFKKAADAVSIDVYIKKKQEGEFIFEIQKRKRFAGYAVPAMVLEAFSCELFLKAIIFEETGTPEQGHFLSELFCKISPERQGQIKDAVVEVYKLEGESFDAGEWELRLKNISNTFKEWRYCFEPPKKGDDTKKEIDAWFLLNFNYKVMEVANEICGTERL